MNKKIDQLIDEAFERKEKGDEPTGEDWWLFRCLSNRKFLFSKRKRAILDYLWNHLCSHSVSEMNNEELFTVRCLK